MSVETLTKHVDGVLCFSADVDVVDDASIKGHAPESAAVASVMAAASRRLGLNATPVELDGTEAYRLLRVPGAPDLPDARVFDSYMSGSRCRTGRNGPTARGRTP